MKSTTAKRQTERARKRALLLQKKRMAAAAKAAAAEEKAEAGAPSVQRNEVRSRDGTVLRGARLEQEGLVFVRSNPIKHLVARSRGKEHPVWRKEHADACEKFRTAYEESAYGISAGTSNYGERAGGATSTGMIADGVLAVVNAQIKARQDLLAIRTFLGSTLWDYLVAVTVQGIDMTAMAERTHMPRDIFAGYVLAAVERLITYYAPEKPKRGHIRSIEIAGMSIETDVAISQ